MASLLPAGKPVRLITDVRRIGYSMCFVEYSCFELVLRTNQKGTTPCSRLPYFETNPWPVLDWDRGLSKRCRSACCLWAPAGARVGYANSRGWLLCRLLAGWGKPSVEGLITDSEFTWKSGHESELLVKVTLDI